MYVTISADISMQEKLKVMICTSLVLKIFHAGTSKGDNVCITTSEYVSMREQVKVIICTSLDLNMFQRGNK